ncbi:obscurin-like isoform X2 [Ornithodoros turicata]|uniref:obscurin-like isoform X2 n=1 Tax=Ornithodoros turicata TaxID=34597 RepID=UPI0031393073
MSYLRSTYRSSRYSEGLSDDSSYTRSSGRTASSLDSEFSSSMSASRRAARTTSYGTDDSSYPTTTVRRSSRLGSSTFDDDDFGTSVRSGRTARLLSRDDDDLGITSSISRRSYTGTSDTRKSSISSLTESSHDTSSSRALRRLKDEDAEEYTSKRSKLSSRTSSSDISGSHSTMSYSSRRISGSMESSELGSSSYLKASKFTYSDSGASETRPEVSAVGEVYEAIMAYKPLSGDEEGVPLKEGQEVEVLDTSMPRKWRIRTKSTHTGVTVEGCVPSCYLEKKEGATVEQALSPKDKESLAKREAVVKELVETEEDFSRDMQYVVNNYLKEMENPSMPKELKEQKDVLFSNFKDISDFHNTELIKGVQYNASEPAKLGVTFLRLERDFDKHVKYCAEAPRAQDLLASGPLKEYFDEFSKRVSDDKSLSDHLKLPIQRINDYQLLLKELIKYTQRLKEDASDLQRALDFMQAIPQRAHDLQQTLAQEPSTPKWSRVLKDTGEMEIREQKESLSEELKTSKAVSSCIEETTVAEASSTKEVRHERTESKSAESSKSSETTAKVDIVEGFEAYQEATTATSAIADSLRSTSMTSLDASAKDSSEKPKFLKSVRGLTCAERDDVTLECEIASTETPKVTWLKDNTNLADSPHIQQKSDGGKYSLVINGITVEDSGMYTVLASNSTGTASCSAPVYVKTGLTVSKGDSRPTSPGGTVLPHAPVFKVKLKDTELLQGTSVRFELVVRGCPEPEVTVYKNGKILKDDDRVKVVFENKEVFEIVIDHIDFQDAGEYSCVAVNSEGRDETTGRITVTKDKILFQGLGDDELEELSAMSPPPKSPAFRWFKDGHEFEASERFQVAFDDAEDTLSLVFQHVTPEDAGLYTCVASTSSGKISCSAELTVQGSIIKKAPEAPTITATLTDVEANEGSSAMLELKVAGYPKPEILWKHDGEVIEAGGRYRFLYEDEETITLVIKNVQKSDAGTYSVTAKNELGSADTKCKLIVHSPAAFKKELKDVSVMTDQPLKLDVEVQGTPSPDVKWYKDGQALSDNGRVKILHPTEDKHELVIDRAQAEDSGNYSCVIKNSTGTQTGFSAVSVNAAPKILKKLENYEACQTETVSFTTKFSGNPKPDVCWLKDGEKVTVDGRKHKVQEEEANVCTLVIEDTQKEDVGEYTVRIANDYGTVEDSASLTIIQKPKFTKKLSDVECEDGDLNIKLTVVVEGAPAPKIKWLFNDEEISENKDYSFQSVEESGEHTLVIKKAKPELAGKVTCEAKNPSGKDACSGSVSVKSKPKIIKGLEDVDVEVGQDATFSVKLADAKDVNVSWLKDGDELTIDGDHLYVKSEADASFTLRIKDVRPEDAGKYGCVAKNKYGEDSSTGRLGTMSKPKFLETLVDEEVSEEQVATFSAEVVGSPTPTVKWLHKGKEIHENEYYEMFIDEENYMLKVKNPQRSLAGEYTCVAENKCGKESSSAKLAVHCKPEIIEGMKDIEGEVGETVSFTVKVSGSPAPEVVWNHNGEEVTVDATVKITEDAPAYTLAFDGLTITLAGDYECVATNIYGEASTAGKLTVKYKPKFEKRPEDTVVYTGEECVFEAVVSGVPTPDVQWLKDGQPISYDDRVKATSHKDVYRLVVKGCKLSDASTYTCTAKNDVGSASCQADLKVKCAEDSEAPTFIRRMTDTLAVIGDKARLEVRVAGKPKPTVTWYKDGEEVTESRRIKIREDDDTHSITLDDVVAEDEAKYSCTAVNEKGEAEDSAALTVKEPVAPSIDGLSDETVSIGLVAKFEAIVTGLPAPEVEWLKDGVKVKGSDNVVLSSDTESGSHTLVIRRTGEDDFGKYTCRATNSAGSAEADAQLNMKGEAPTFVKELTDAKVSKGDDATFSARIKGYPTPTATWILNEKEIVDSENVEIACKGELYTLKIRGVDASTVGTVICKAKNSAGQASSEATLSLEVTSPVIQKELPSHVDVTEGEPLKLESKVGGEPLPDVKWLKDGKPVVPDEHIKLEQSPDGNVALMIENAKPEDAGKYSLVATNEKGDAGSASDVAVTPEEAITPRAAPVKPSFAEGITPAKVEEGKPFKLEVKAAGDEPLEIEWLKDGLPVTPDEHVKIQKCPDGKSVLSVDEARPSDAGKYEAVAKNDAGDATTDGDVKVIPEEAAKQKAAPVKPSFTEGVKPTVIEEGKPFKLAVKATGDEPLEIEWLKDGVPVTPDEHVKIQKGPDGTSVLRVDDARPSDVGKYAAVAKNDAGDAKTEGDVKAAPAPAKEGPKFLSGLQDTDVKEGEPLRLAAKVQSDTPFTPKWLKNGKPITPDGRTRCEQTPDGTVILVIEDAKPEDAGSYQLVVANEDGETATGGDVAVHPEELSKPKPGLVKPKFTQGISPTMFTEGKPAKLQVECIGSQPINIQWTKDGIPVEPSQHIKIEAGPDGTSALIIDNAVPSDAGRYAALATNEAGEANTEGKALVTPAVSLSGMKPEFTLEVKGANLLEGQPLNLVGKVKSDTPFTVKWLKDGEELTPSDRISVTQEPDGTVVLSIEHVHPDDSGKYVCVATNPEGRTRSAGVVEVAELPKSKPEIVDELKPAAFKEGEPGKLEAKVTGEPLPDVKWIKDGHELPDDGRIRSTTSPGGDVVLSIDPVKPDDAGKYSLVAANDQGECRTTAPVVVNQPPIFKKPLEPVEVVEGYPARLDTKLTGEPVPDTEWKKDGEPLIPDGDKVVETKTPEGDVALVIPKARPEDSGTYSCKAKNPFGDTETKAPLKVVGADTTGQPEEKPKVSPLDDVNVLEGEPFAFESKVTGTPLPEVKWYLDDQPVLPSDNIHATFDGRKARLSVKKSHPSHAGVFECRAMNPVGKASSCGTASVTGMSKPKFTKRLSDMEAPHNQPLQLQCRVTGHPEPEVTWYYNEKPIEPGLKYSMTRDGDLCGLTIPWPRDKDSGVYKCRAKNPLGEDWCDAKVSVRDKAERGEPPSFVKRLNNLDTPEGSTAKFTACIAGTPFPEVKWFKDGEELPLTNRHRVEVEPNGLLRLIIRDVRPEDAGEYRASIYNPHGSDSSIGSLRLEIPVGRRKQRPTADRYPSYEKPEPSSPLESKPPELNGYEPYPGGRYTHEPPSSPHDRRDLPQPSPYEPVERMHEPGDVTQPSAYKPVEPHDRGDLPELYPQKPDERPRDRDYPPAHLIRERPRSLDAKAPSSPYDEPYEREEAPRAPHEKPYGRDDQATRPVYDKPYERDEEAPRSQYEKPRDRDAEQPPRAPYDRPSERGDQRPHLGYEKPYERDEEAPRSPYEKPRDRDAEQPPRTPYDRPSERGDQGPRPGYEKPYERDEEAPRSPYEKPRDRDVLSDQPPRTPYDRPSERGDQGPRLGYEKPYERDEEAPRSPYEKPRDRDAEQPPRTPYDRPSERGDQGPRPRYEEPYEGSKEAPRSPYEKPRERDAVPEFATGKPYDKPVELSRKEPSPSRPYRTPGDTDRVTNVPSRTPYDKPEERAKGAPDASRVPQYERPDKTDREPYTSKPYGRPGDRDGISEPSRSPYEAPDDQRDRYERPSDVPSSRPDVDHHKTVPSEAPSRKPYDRPDAYEAPSRPQYEKTDVGGPHLDRRPDDRKPDDRHDERNGIPGSEPYARETEPYDYRTFPDVGRPYEKPEGQGWVPQPTPHRDDRYKRPPHKPYDRPYDREPTDIPSYKPFDRPEDHRDLYEPRDRPHDYANDYQPADRPSDHDRYHRPVPHMHSDIPPVHGGDYTPLPTFKPFDRPDVSMPYRGHPPISEFEPPTYERPRHICEYEPYYTGVPSPLSDTPHIRRMSDRHVTIGWTPSIPRAPRVPVTYILEMASHPDGEWHPYQTGIKDTQLDVRGLEPFKDYRFRVKVANKHGVSAPSPHVVAHRSQLRGEPPVPKDFKPKDYEIEHPPLDKHGSPPRFLRREEDVIYGIRGHPVSIEFWVYGHPQPDVTWHFKDTKLEKGGRYDSLQDRNGQVTLFITRMTEENVGSYTCCAVNEHGEAMKSIYLDLAEEPVFTKRLEPTTIMVHRGGQLQCRVIGKPYPKIKWYKDWHPIADSSRTNIIWEAPDVCTMTLNESISRDAGLYSCSASNIAGTASCSATLTIEESEDEFAFKTYRQPRVVKPRSKLFEEYYDIGDELGRGTQGITYHAVERESGKSYGVKAMHGTGRFKDWMRHELDMMGQLCHPKLLRLWDAFETKQSMSLITDLCGGGELLDNITSRDKLSEHEIANYIRQVLEGLNHMHSQNIAHLGLTLGDVLVTHINGDTIKIGDFSLATRLHKNKDFIQEYGHPEFVAPEIAHKRPATLSSDMWSVGVMTYILLSGISPFLGQNDRETLKNVQNGKINFLDDSFAEVSDDARDFIGKLLVFEPSERLNVKAALDHPWLKIAEVPDKGDSLSNIDRLRDYHKKWKSWYANASCRRCYRRRPLESCFTHPSRMIYPPDEVYTPPESPAREIGRTKVKPSQFDETYAEKVTREPIDIRSESNYQGGPDTYLLQLRDVDFPLRLREYLRVGAKRSPSLAANLREKHWGGFQAFEHSERNTYPQVVVRERRKFVDVMDEEIDDEKKGLSTRTMPLRLQREVGSLGYTHQQLEHLKQEAMKGKRPVEMTTETAPYFREKIQDCVIRENDEAVFKCFAVGNPPPQYSWFRNDGLLIESSRIQFKKSPDGRIELHLNPGKAYDVGVFKCVARNARGTTVCHARLRVGGRPGRPEHPVCEQCSSNQIYVHWCNPKYEGNSRTLYFCLEMRETGATEWTKVSENITHEFWVVHDLKPSTSYEFRVSAKNQFGWSEVSIPSDPCTTEPEGSTQKIKISRAHKFQQDMAERGQEAGVGAENGTAIDYSREDNPVQLATGGVQELYNFVSEVYVGRYGGVVNGWAKEQKCSASLKAVIASSDIESSAKREYEILKSLSHERVVSLMTASFHDGLVILGLERLPGVDILTYLTLRHQYNEDTVARIIKQVLDAVEYLHFRGMCYVELQPDNVVMTDEHTCNVKLVDFGSAQFISRPVCERPQAGSLEYLPPEVLKDQELSPATDIWGVGVLLYILVSGCSPFLGADDEDTRNNILYVRYHFDKLYKEASTEVTRFLMMLFKRRPEKRPTVAECLENKWLLPSEFMLRKREHSVFTSSRLQEFAAEFHSKKTKADTREKLVKLLGTSFSRSVSLDTDVIEEY